MPRRGEGIGIVAARLLGDEHGEAFVAFFIGIGARQKRHDIAARGMGDPGLVAFDPVDIAVPHGPGPQGSQVGTGVGLGEDGGGQDLARSDQGQPLGLLVFRAAQTDQFRRDLGAGAERAKADVAARELFRDHAHGELAEAQAAEFLRHGQAENAELRELIDHRERDQLILKMPLVGFLHVIVGELVELVPDHVEGLVAQGRVAVVAARTAFTDQDGKLLPDGCGMAAGDQCADGRGREFLFRLLRDAHVGEAQNFHLAQRDAAADLAQVFAVGRLEHQLFQFPQSTFSLQALRPVQHLTQCGCIGAEPGKAMDRELLTLQQGGIRLSVWPHDQRRHRGSGLIA